MRLRLRRSLRLNVKDGPGQALAYRWQVTGVPTFVVLDGNGAIVYRRAGAPDAAGIKAALLTASESNN